MDIIGDINRFNDRILGLPVPDEPKVLDPARLDWVCHFITEEMAELISANNAGNVAEAADAIGDLIYGVAGRFMEMGVDGREIMREIHAANMQKKKGEQAKRPGSLGYDAIKPDGWLPPNHEPLPRFEKHGYKNVIVIGHGEHGKDKIGEMLCQRHFYLYKNASMVLAERLINPIMKYDSAEDCFNDRKNHRKFWHDTIAEYNSPEKDRVAKLIFSQYEVYCGIRCPEELEAARQHADLVVWVEREGHPYESEDSMKLMASDADYIIRNNGGLDDLAEEVDKLARILGVL